MDWFNIDTEVCDMPNGWHLRVQARVTEGYGWYTLFQPITCTEKPTDEQIEAAYQTAMRRIEAKRLEDELEAEIS